MLSEPIVSHLLFLIRFMVSMYWSWAHLGSNQGPTGYEPVALPAELWAHIFKDLMLTNFGGLLCQVNFQ